MKASEFKDFTALIHKIWKASKDGRSKPVPDSEMIEFYFSVLQDLELSEIRENALKYYRNTKGGWFPSVAELRQGEDPEVKAMSDFRLLKDLVESYCGYGIGQSGMRAVNIRLETMKRTDLLPLLNEFRDELYTNDNPTATRAQFLKAHKAIETIKENNRLLVEHEKNKQIEGCPAVKDLATKVVRII